MGVPPPPDGLQEQPVFSRDLEAGSCPLQGERKTAEAAVMWHRGAGGGDGDEEGRGRARRGGTFAGKTRRRSSGRMHGFLVSEDERSHLYECLTVQDFEKSVFASEHTRSQ